MTGTDTNQYAVIIPAYKKCFDADECAAVDAYFKVLTGDMFFVIPQNFDASWYEERYKKAHFTRFPDKYFKGTDGYNILMLSDGFYAAFAKYEYILIAQPDAALLSDEDRIPSFIKKGYDYIGAPWEPERNIWEWTFSKKHFGVKCLKKKGNGIVMGNGGFSLRNIKKCRALLKEFAWRKLYWYRSEDIFFGVFGPDNRSGFIPADKKTGRKFSLEYGIKEAVQAGEAPFAVHGWSKEFADYNEMRSFMEKHGVHIW